MSEKTLARPRHAKCNSGEREESERARGDLGILAQSRSRLWCGAPLSRARRERRRRDLRPRAKFWRSPVRSRQPRSTGVRAPYPPSARRVPGHERTSTPARPIWPRGPASPPAASFRFRRRRGIGRRARFAPGAHAAAHGALVLLDRHITIARCRRRRRPRRRHGAAPSRARRPCALAHTRPPPPRARARPRLRACPQRGRRCPA